MTWIVLPYRRLINKRAQSRENEATHQAHIVTEQPSLPFFVTVPEETNPFSLILAQESVDTGGNLVCKIQSEGLEDPLARFQRECRSWWEILCARLSEMRTGVWCTVTHLRLWVKRIGIGLRLGVGAGV